MRFLYIKSLAIAAILYFNPTIGKAQSPFTKYRVEYSQQPFINLTNPDYVFFSSEKWLDSSYKLKYWDAKLGGLFDFTFNNEKMNHFIYNVSNFSISFLGDSSSFNTRPIASNTREYSNVIPYQTKVSAIIDTATVEKIFKVEFKQLGLTDSSWQTKGYLNMQYWFYSNGDFEVRYGDCSIPKELWSVKKPIYSGEGKYKIQFSLSNSGSYYFYTFGNYNNPNTYTSNLIKFTTESKKLDSLFRDSTLSQVPISGSVYRYTTRGVGIDELRKINSKNIILYPNPSKGSFHINGLSSYSDYKLSVFDMSGKKIFVQDNLNYNDEINLSAFENGLYYVTISNAEECFSKKIIINR